MAFLFYTENLYSVYSMKENWMGKPTEGEPTSQYKKKMFY